MRICVGKTHLGKRQEKKKKKKGDLGLYKIIISKYSYL